MAEIISRQAKTLLKKAVLLVVGFFFISLLWQDVINAEVIFEDNFDIQDDWTITQPTGSSESCISNCDVPTGWTGYRNGFSYCDGGPGYNNIYLNQFIGYPSEKSERGRGGGGKALTFWDESCCNFFEDSDGMLAVHLDQECQELYIRFFIKFGHIASDPEMLWQLGYLSSGTGSHKLLHVQHYLDGNPWSYFYRNEGNQPVFVANFKHWNDWYEATGTGRCFCGNGGGEDCYYCGGTPSGSGGFSGRVGTYDWYDNGAIGDGNWHCVEWRLKMNTYDEVNETFRADGIMQFWHDGVLYLEKTNIPWNQNGSDTNPIRGFSFISIGGNNQNRWITDCTGTECEQWYAIDDVVISTEYIGPDYVIGVLKGDVNGDKEINDNDVDACVKHILGTQDWGDAADVNGDLSVNSLDVQQIVNVILSQ
ncbi:MAG: dockerin type I domain-containing protein [Thermodesulfobacteriota bacterium]|nr:dockerin type I domain-containing protein [Thermodesulfobacteriota bacterium]